MTLHKPDLIVAFLKRLSIIFLLLLNSACDQITGSRTYDDCILESMKGVNSDVAAKMIYLSCRKKFPTPKPVDFQLPTAALEKLTGHGGINDYGFFSGNIYNGNKDWTVTQVTIMLMPRDKVKTESAVSDAKEYSAQVSVSPLTSNTFAFEVDGRKEDYSWSIVGARGHK